MWREAGLFRAASLLTIIFPVLLLGTAASDIALCAIALLFLAHCWRQHDWNWCHERWAQILAVFWLYMIARGLLAEHPKEALGRALPFGRYIIFAAALARWTLKDDATRRRFLAVLTGFVLACALDGLLQYAAGRDLLWHKIIYDPTSGHIRLAGPFTRPVLGIMLTWLAFPVLLPTIIAIKQTCHPREGRGLGQDSRLRGNDSVFKTFFCLIVTAAIALSGERMALLLFLLGWLMAMLMLRPRKRFVLAGLMGLAALFAGLALLSPDMVKRQVSSTEETLTHWQGSPYGKLLESDLRLAALEPVTGLGANHFRSACETLYAGDAARIAAMCNTHPHNIWLEWLIEEGVIGLAFFAAFVIVILRDALIAFRQRRDPLLSGLLIAFVLRIWPLMSTTGFFSRWGAPPFWLALGALLVYTARQRGNDADSSFTVQIPGL